MRMLAYIFTSLLFLLGACQPKIESSDLQIASVAQNRPLAISGTWQATEIWAFRTNQLGERTASHEKSDKLKNDFWRTVININSDGEGSLQGIAHCQGPGPANSLPNSIRSNQAFNALTGLLSLPDILNSTNDSINCAKSSGRGLATAIPVNHSRDFFGRKLSSLPKNLGVFGEKKSVTAADSECRTLRGVRFINVKDAAACVGFTDGSANQLRFLIVPPGEIFAMRVDMQRE